jgi:hypothetical protein
MREKLSLLPVIGLVAGLTGSANAALIGLDLLEAPDVFSGFTDVQYTALSDEFLVTGESLSYDPDGIGAPETIANGSFDITATVDDAGLASAGSIIIGGDIPGLGVIGPDLLTGSLVDFGFEDPPGGAIFEFLFEVTGGDLAPDYGGAGALFGVILDINSNVFDGTWLSDFETTGGAGVADTAPLVPAPSVLALAALAPLAVRRRRRTTRH